VVVNRAMSSESVEWGYKDVGALWKYLAFGKQLKLRTSQLADAYLTGMISASV
jgi:hypothetical protein